jgi:hypothetical protein
LPIQLFSGWEHPLPKPTRHQFAVAIGPVKDKPSRARELRVLDRPCARLREARVACSIA